MGMVRFMGSNYIGNKPYIFNNTRFDVSRSKFISPDGNLTFMSDPTHYYKYRYRTIYGYAFAHNGVIYNNNIHNLNVALRRHFSIRQPEIPGKDRWLRDNLTRHVIRNSNDLISSLQFVLGLLEHGVIDFREDAEHLRFVPHDKLVLRVADLERMTTDGTIGREQWLLYCIWKLKLDEFAKFGKFGRIIVDLGISASLQGAMYAERVKAWMGDRVIPYKHGKFIFCTKPDPEEVMKWFNLLRNDRQSITFLVFSDDCCVSLYGEMYNLDLTSCDSSHETAIFDLLFDITSCPQSIREALVVQVLSKIRVDNPEKKGERTFFKPTTMYLQSGITITTILNVVAWYVIFKHVIDSGLGDKIEHVVASGESVGYLMDTPPVCEIFEDLQFLKMSPVMDITGVYRAMLNAGVICRASGTCRGDLQGRGPIRERAEKFQALLMSGLLSGVSCEELLYLVPESYRSSFRTMQSEKFKTGSYTVDYMLKNRRGMVPHPCTFDAWIRRYHFTPDQVDQLRIDLKEIGFGKVCYSDEASAILGKDYGLSYPDVDWHHTNEMEGRSRLRM